MELRYKDKTLTASGGTKYSAGEGITIEGEVINVTTPVKSVLTQDEFDALSEEEKSKGFYVIADEGSEGGSTGGVSLEEVNNAIDTAIQDSIGDINSILDSINGEVV